MKVITAGKSNHTDYVDVKKAEKLTAYAGKSRQERFDTMWSEASFKVASYQQFMPCRQI